MTDDGNPGRDHVDLNRERRTDSALVQRFEAFADLECAPAGSGMSVHSPTYALLARHVARRRFLLALARECRLGQPIPNLLFAAVKRLVGDAPDEPLSGLYRRIAEGEEPPADLGLAFENFSGRHAERIIDLVRERNVQTNEVGRCSHLMPAFGLVAQTTGERRPVFHIASEGERMDVARIEAGRSTTLLSVLRSAHGRWVQW